METMPKYSRFYLKCLDLTNFFLSHDKKNVSLKEIQDYIMKYIGGSRLTFNRYMPFLIRMGFMIKKEDGTYDIQDRRDDS